MRTSFDGDFYDADYFERGKQSGKGWLENYRWIPQRSLKEAAGFIDFADIKKDSSVLDVGCAKGFIVKALRILGYVATGCDISIYALGFAPDGCWNSSIDENWCGKKYTHVIIKDVLEHCTQQQLEKTLSNISIVSEDLTCVVPLGENGKYIIDEYHTEVSHLIIKDIQWWRETFLNNGWEVVKGTYHVDGIKDNWYSVSKKGNYVFRLNKK